MTTLQGKSDMLEQNFRERFVEKYIKPGIKQSMKEGRNMDFKLYISPDMEQDIEHWLMDPDCVGNQIAKEVQTHGVRSQKMFFGYDVVWGATQTGLFEHDPLDEQRDF